MSLGYALSQKINQNPNAFDSIDEREAMIEVRDWVSEHSQDCWEALGDGFPTPFFPQVLDSSWFLDNAWADADLENITFGAEVLVSGVYAPLAGYDTCQNLHENDTKTIPLEWPGKFSDIIPLTLDEGDGSVEGPEYGGGRVTAADEFASAMTSCAEPTCSRASVSMDAIGGWAIDEMVLYVDGNLGFDNGTETESVTDARLELYGPAVGTTVFGIPPIPTEYTVAAGAASFLAVGKADGDDEWVMIPMVNSTQISATESSGEWSFEPFELEYTDDSNELWTVSVGAAVWIED